MSRSRNTCSRRRTCTPVPFGTIKVQWPLPAGLPLVSIIVPTQTSWNCCSRAFEGVLERTAYANFEVLIIDNGSVEQSHQGLSCRIVRGPQSPGAPLPPVRFPSANQQPCGRTGPRRNFICLLNNDTEVIEPDWLTELMRYAVRPEVGAVGAKLLYDDGSIQHAGVIVGDRRSGGPCPPLAPGTTSPAISGRRTSRSSSAPSRRRAWWSTSASSSRSADSTKRNLPVAFNDVDLCLKLQKAGWRNVYVPHAVLLHHESKSRGSDMLRRNIDRFRREERVLQERWGTRNYNDPLLNPNLDPATETFVIRL